MTQKKTKIYLFYLVAVLGGFLAADLLFGVALSILNLSPKINEFAPGIQSYRVEAHPHKSYKVKETDSQLWVQNKGTINNREYDYSLLKPGTITNRYGHAVLPSESRLDALPKANNEVRIFFTGGSTTYQPWPHLIQGELEALYPSVDTKVINAGVGGYTSMENMIDVTTTASAYDPDIVVAYLPVNDVYWATAYEHDWIAHDYSHMRTEFILQSDNGPTESPKPQRITDVSYPFIVSFMSDWVYSKHLEDYFAQRSLSHSVLEEGWSFDPARVTPAKLELIAQLVARNVFLMHSMCKYEGCEFVFITQKMFRADGFEDNPYIPFVEEVVARIPELLPKEVNIINLDKIFPSAWTEKDSQSVKKWYLQKEKQPADDFESYLSYDDMHFSPEALVLLSKKLAPKIAKFAPLYN